MKTAFCIGISGMGLTQSLQKFGFDVVQGVADGFFPIQNRSVAEVVVTAHQTVGNAVSAFVSSLE